MHVIWESENADTINQFAIDGYFPDTTIFLNLDYEDGLKRIETRAFKDRLDLETKTFHQEVSEGYRQVLAKYRHRMHVVDASQDVDKVAADALQIVLRTIENERKA